jgi:hypothetical protein
MKCASLQRLSVLICIPLISFFTAAQMISKTVAAARGGSLHPAASLAGGSGAVSQSAQPLDHLSLNVARRGHTSTLLADGGIVIIGGENQNGWVREAEILDPRSRAISVVARAINPRAKHSATLLSDGRVLIVGGAGPSGWFRESMHRSERGH